VSATTRCGASSAATSACPRWCTATCWRRWRSDRARFLPWGTRGGSSGTAGANLLNPDRGAGGERLPGKFLRSLKHGDVYRLVQPGGGGYGDPLERDPEAVREDAAQGKISAAHARAAYGVVLAIGGWPGRLDRHRRAAEVPQA